MTTLSSAFAKPIEKHDAFMRGSTALTLIAKAVAKLDFPDTLGLVENRPMLFAGNHRSLFDMVATLAIFNKFGLSCRIMLRGDYMVKGPGAAFLHSIGCIPTSRDQREAAEAEAIASLGRGELVALMPEGRLIPPDQWVETPIDLSAPFNLAGSQLVVRVEPTRKFSATDDDYWRNRPTIAWVQNTTLGIDAFFDDDQLLIWTTDLATGQPISGVPIELIGDGRIATTDEEGLAELDLGTEGVLGLWANAGDRTAFLPSDWWEGWRAQDSSDDGRWYVFDDRGIYRPGETVRLTGWVRRFARSEDGQLALYGNDVTVGYV